MMLTKGQKEKVLKRLYNRINSDREETGLTHQDWVAAVDAADAWIDANQGGYNAALPTKVRTEWNGTQKARLFYAVARQIYQPEE